MICETRNRSRRSLAAACLASFPYAIMGYPTAQWIQSCCNLKAGETRPVLGVFALGAVLIVLVFDRMNVPVRRTICYLPGVAAILCGIGVGLFQVVMLPMMKMVICNTVGFATNEALEKTGQAGSMRTFITFGSWSCEIPGSRDGTRSSI